MKTLIFTLSLILFPSVIFSQRIVKDSVMIDGHMRYYRMMLPENLKKNAPLVFVLHGYDHNPEDKFNTWMDSAAMNHNFAICNPSGLKDPEGKHSWNVGYPFQNGWEIDDVAMLQEMAMHVQKKYSLSRENTFLTGMSNGGEMCYLLAYSHQHTFKALASIAGLTMQWIYDTMDASVPVPFLEIHGTEDRISEWYGDIKNEGGWGEYIPVELATGYLAAKNRCIEEEKPDTVPGLDKKNGHYVIRHRFNNPKTHNDVWLYEVKGAPHCWFTDDMETGEEVWKFFSRYLK